MMTSSNGNIFLVTGPLCGEFTGRPAQRPVTRRFEVSFDLRLNKRLSKQWRGWWFETLSCPLWHHCNVVLKPEYSWITRLIPRLLMAWLRVPPCHRQPYYWIWQLRVRQLIFCCRMHIYSRMVDRSVSITLGCYYAMTSWNIFRVTGPLWGESTGGR